MNKRISALIVFLIFLVVPTIYDFDVGWFEEEIIAEEVASIKPVEAKVNDGNVADEKKVVEKSLNGLKKNDKEVKK